MGPAIQTIAALIVMTKNNQGNPDGPPMSGYCLAGMTRAVNMPARLIRIVPGVGHFWTEDTMPMELSRCHDRLETALSFEPQWQYRPVVVGFEAGTLPDTVTGPHRADDVVARNLTYLGPLEDCDDLDLQLSRIAYDNIDEAWPPHAWASPKSIISDADVPSLVVFRGYVKYVLWRQLGSPSVTLSIGRKEVQLPYAGHRLHTDRGFAMLDWLKNEKCPSLILLGLSRTFNKISGEIPQCPILLLRVFPIP